MSTFRRLAQGQASFVIEQWVKDNSGRDSHAIARDTIQIASQLHAVTAPVDIIGRNPANENQEPAGGFDCHLGVYRRA
jgi:hypothetical protein